MNQGSDKRRKGHGAVVKGLPLTLPMLSTNASTTARSGVPTHPNLQSSKSKTRSVGQRGGVRNPVLHKTPKSLSSSFAVPRVPQSSEVHLLGNPQSTGASYSPPRQGMSPPRLRNVGGTNSDPHIGGRVRPQGRPLTDLYPGYTNHSAFKSTTYLRNVTLPGATAISGYYTRHSPAVQVNAVGTAKGRLLPSSFRQITMSKERYLPVNAPPAHGASDDSTIEGLWVPSISTSCGLSERLEAHTNELEKARWLRRTSEFIPHRVSLGYNMHGGAKQLHERFQISDESLARLENLNATNRLLYGPGIQGNSKPMAVKKLQEQSKPSPSSPDIERPVSITVVPASPAPGTVVPASPAPGTDRKVSSSQLPTRGSPLPSFSVPQDSGDETPSAAAGDEMDLKEDTAAADNGAADVASMRSGSKEGSGAEGGRGSKAHGDKETAVRGPGIMLTSTGDGRGMLQDMSKLVRKESFQADEDIFAHMESFVSDQHRRMFTDRFKLMDRAGRGKISLEDLKREMSSTKDDAHYVMEVFDLDGSGTIDLEEFIAVAALNDRLSTMLHGKNPTTPLELNLELLAYHIGNFKALFKLVDDSGDSRVETSEVLILIAAAFGISAFDEKLAKLIVTRIDKDNSGFIEFVEFMQYIPFFLKLQRKIVKDPLALDMVSTAKKGLEKRKSQAKMVTTGITKRRVNEWSTIDEDEKS